MKKKGRIIEIDDAGTGDLVGNAFIGFHVLETKELIFRTIPVSLYNEKNLSENAPKKRIVKLVKDGLEALHFNKEEDKILICRGDCFDLVRVYFNEEGITHEPAIIEGELQDAVEGRFIAHLRKIGVRSRNLTIKSGAKRYFVLYNWLCYDFPNRERFVKSGFKKWRTVNRDRALEKYNQIKRSKYSNNRNNNNNRSNSNRNNNNNRSNSNRDNKWRSI